MKPKGFILPTGLTLYAAIGALVVIGLLGIALKIQSARLEAVKKEYAAFVAKVEVLGEQAKAEKLKKEKEHAKVLEDVSKAWQGSLDAAVSGAVAKYRMRQPSPGIGALPGIAGDPKTPNGACEEQLACEPRFIQDCAADAAKIESFQEWAREIGFPVK